jgi:glycosyltransferase involved in cell wall biosynthesis
MTLLFVRITSNISGAEIYTLNLAIELTKNGNHVYVLTNYKPFLDLLIKNNIFCKLLNFFTQEIGTKKNFFNGLAISPISLLEVLYIIRKVESESKVDTIILESMSEKIFFTFPLKLLSYRVLWIEHGCLYSSNRFFLIKTLYKLISKITDKIIAVSNDTKKDLINGGVNTDKVTVIYYGIPSAYTRFSNEIVSDRDSLVIGFIGNFNKEKGSKTFMKISMKLIKNKFPIKFIIIGGGNDIELFKQTITRYNFENRYIFLGEVENVWKNKLTLDILFAPTYKEGLSLALLEALAMGKIVVARDVGGNRELIIDKKTGFLFNTDEEAEEILKGIIIGTIPTEEIRKNALEHVRKNFNMKTQLPKFLEVFHG